MDESSSTSDSRPRLNSRSRLGGELSNPYPLVPMMEQESARPIKRRAHSAFLTDLFGHSLGKIKGGRTCRRSTPLTSTS